MLAVDSRQVVGVYRLGLLLCTAIFVSSLQRSYEARMD